MSTVAHTELPIIILHVLVAAADIPCALQNREYERSACGWLIASTRSLSASAWTQCYRNFRARGSMYRGGLWHAARPTRWRQLPPRAVAGVSDTC